MFVCGLTVRVNSEGWDPTTGWGIPNFGLLKDIVLKF